MKRKKTNPKLPKTPLHTYESVAAAFAGGAVGYHNGLLDIAVHAKVLPQALVGRVVRQPAHEQLRPGRVLLAALGGGRGRRRAGAARLHQRQCGIGRIRGDLHQHFVIQLCDRCQQTCCHCCT